MFFVYWCTCDDKLASYTFFNKGGAVLPHPHPAAPRQSGYKTDDRFPIIFRQLVIYCAEGKGMS